MSDPLKGLRIEIDSEGLVEALHRITAATGSAAAAMQALGISVVTGYDLGIEHKARRLEFFSKRLARLPRGARAAHRRDLKRKKR